MVQLTNAYAACRTARGRILSWSLARPEFSQINYYLVTKDAEYLNRATRLARGLVQAYTDSDGSMKHDRDPWADAYLVYDWLSAMSKIPTLPNTEARRAVNHSTYFIYNYRRTEDGYFGPTWSTFDGAAGAASVWGGTYSGANALQLTVSGNAANMIAAGANRSR